MPKQNNNFLAARWLALMLAMALSMSSLADGDAAAVNATPTPVAQPSAAASDIPVSQASAAAPENPDSAPGAQTQEVVPAPTVAPQDVAPAPSAEAAPKPELPASAETAPAAAAMGGDSSPSQTGMQSTTIPGYPGADEESDQEAADKRFKVEKGSGKFINEEAALRRDGDGAYSGDIAFNFEGESIQSVVKAILGEFFQENYVIAPGVGGQVTFSTAKPITPPQAMAVLEMLLAWNNATLVYRDGRYTVLPVAQAIQGNLLPRIGPTEEAKGYELRVVPLKYISATEMEKLLQPYARAGGIVKADNSRAMMIVGGTRRDLDLYLQTIEIFDVDWLAGMSVGVYPLERVEATTVVPELEKIFGEGGPTPLAGLFRFMPIERINAVMVITPQPDYLERAQEWVYKLDRGGSDSGSQLFVYYVKNVKADDLAEKLSEIFTGTSSGSKSGAKPSGVGGVAPGLNAVEIKTLSNRDQPKESAPAPTGGAQDGIGIVQSDNIRITSIEESNALMIRATPGEYDSILGAIKRLDIVPLQVHIEAKVLQVNLADKFQFGVKWYFENAASDATTGAYRNLRRNNPVRDVWNSFAGTVSGENGLGWTFLNVEAEAILTALQSDSNVSVISAPSLVVLNNKEASINAGTQIAIQTPVFSSFNTVVQNPSDPNQNTNVQPFPGGTQYLETGVTLNVTPRVNPGGLVYLEIQQEESTPGERPPGQFTAPPIDKRTIKTEIAVQSGETVLLGGLIRETKTKGRSGVPGLVKVPLLGRLFGSTNNDTARQELLVMIKPTVIENADAARDMTIEFKKRFDGLKPLLKKQQRIDDKIQANSENPQ